MWFSPDDARPASLVLCAYLCQLPVSDFRGKTVLELGAGCGLVGLLLARAFPVRRVLLTDITETVLDNLEHNVSLLPADCKVSP